LTAEGLENLECYEKKFSGGIELDTCYDKNAEELVFKAVIPNNSWFAIGFGPTMTNTDMIAWFADDKIGETRDLWSTSHAAPKIDETNSLVEFSAPSYDAATDMMTFITRRALDTGDSG
jgi:hypothetical protein